MAESAYPKLYIVFIGKAHLGKGMFQRKSSDGGARLCAAELKVSSQRCSVAKGFLDIEFEKMNDKKEIVLARADWQVCLHVGYKFAERARI